MIKSKDTFQYLYAAPDELKKDPDRRRIFTGIKLNPTNLSDPQNWGKRAEWEIIKTKFGFLIKNLEYSDYMYVAGDPQSDDENRRSVYAWKDFDTLGEEENWKFEKVLL